MLLLLLADPAAQAQDDAVPAAVAEAGPVASDAPDLVAPPELVALLQIWGTAWDMDEDPQADPATYGDPEDDVGFKLRRARVGIAGGEGTIGYALSVGAESRYDTLDPASETVGLEDAFVLFRPYEAANVVVGLHKVPVGREQLVSSRELALSERAVLSEWIVPGRDVGVTGDWQIGVGRVRIGTYNGNGSILGDDNVGLLFAGRFEIATGGDDAHDEVYRTWGEVDGMRLGIAVDGLYDLDLATNEMAGGADAMLRAGGLAVLVEARMSQLSPADTTIAVPDVVATTTRTGALLQVGYTLGAWEPAVRGAWFDDAKALEDNGDVAEVSGGLGWHGEDDHVKAGLVYVTRLELQGAALDNDTARLWLQLAL
jgi:hypothetical protein